MESLSKKVKYQLQGINIEQVNKAVDSIVEQLGKFRHIDEKEKVVIRRLVYNNVLDTAKRSADEI